MDYKKVEHKEINGEQYCIIADARSLEAPKGRLIVLVGENRIHDTIALRVRQFKDYATKDGGLPTITVSEARTAPLVEALSGTSRAAALQKHTP